MKKSIFILTLLFLVTGAVFAQNEIVQFEYWADNNYSGKSIISITPAVNAELNQMISINGLKPGLHALNFRFLDDSGRYSAVSTQLIEAFSSGAEIISYEYWFDNFYSQKTEVQVNPAVSIDLKAALIDASALPNGMHVFHIRFADQGSKWSAAQSSFLYKSGKGISLFNEIFAYRYWIDNDFAGNIRKTLSQIASFVDITEMLDLNGFPKGNHYLHIQFQDTSGEWSAVMSQNLHILPNSGNAGSNLISAYRYWNGSNFVNAVPVAVNPVANAEIRDSLDFSTENSGVQIIHFQFRDTMNLWSSIITDTVKVIHAIQAGFQANPSALCDSGTVTFLNSSSSFANKFSWSFGDTAKSSLKNTSHFYDTLGNYIVKLLAIDTVTGIKDSVTHVVSVFPKPKVNLGNDTTIFKGLHIILDGGNPGLMYHWSNGNSNQTIIAATAGLYIVEVSNAGCSVSDSINVYVIVGIRNDFADKYGIRIFPNPAINELNISAEIQFPESQITIVNANGQTVYSEKCGLSHMENISLKDFNMGIYFLQISGIDGVYNCKFIIEK